MSSVNVLSHDWYYCSKCKTSFFVRSDDPDIGLLKKGMRCPNFVTCEGRIRHRAFTNALSRIDNSKHVTAVELFQASAGLGLPGERKCSPAEVRKALIGARIFAAHTEKAPDPQKTILLSLTLDNGKILHLASSTRGAIIYKVTEA